MTVSEALFMPTAMSLDLTGETSLTDAVKYVPR